MPNRLSHSAMSKYQFCPKSWELHYVKRLRSTIQKSSLAFGSAIDLALQAEFTPGGPTAEEAFSAAWTNQKVNNVTTYLPTATNIVYAESDFDADLITKVDWTMLAKTHGFAQDAIEQELNKVFNEKEYEGFKGLPENRKALLNHANWLCLYRKGLLMIEACRTQVTPNIERVLSLQEKVSLTNAEGDEIIGFVDIVAHWKGIDTPVILDFKTSSIKYESDAVLTSPQLTLYSHDLAEKYQTRKAGFIIFGKRIIKNKTKVCSVCGVDGTSKKARTCDVVVDKVRCEGAWTVKLNPKCYVQVLIDDIPPQTEEIVLENSDFINKSIKAGIFHRNFQSCISNFGPCVFLDLCYKNKMTDLIEVPEEPKK